MAEKYGTISELSRCLGQTSAREKPSVGLEGPSSNVAQPGPQLAVETSKTAVFDAEEVASIANAVGMSR